MYDLSQTLYVERQSPMLPIHSSSLGLAHRAFAEKAIQGLQSWFPSGCTLSLMTGTTPDSQTSMCSIRQDLWAPGMFRIEAMSLGQGQLVLLSPTSVDVFPIHSIFHKGNVVISGQCEMGDAAHEASHVLSVGVKSDFLHSTCKEARREGEKEARRGVTSGRFFMVYLNGPWPRTNCLVHHMY